MAGSAETPDTLVVEIVRFRCRITETSVSGAFASYSFAVVMMDNEDEIGSSEPKRLEKPPGAYALHINRSGTFGALDAFSTLAEGLSDRYGNVVCC